MIELSIIIVNYNALDLLENCLESIYKHLTNTNFEVIVVDNNTTSGSVAKITSKFENTHLIANDENKGFAKANNQGLEIAEGKYVLFLNNDTLFIEDTVTELIQFISEENENIFVGCKLLNKDLSHQISVVDFDTITNLFGENFFLYKIFPKSRTLNRYHFNFENLREPTEVDVIKGAFILSPRNKLLELGGFDEKFFFYSEETDLCYRFKKSGGKVYYYPGTSIIHLGGASTDNIQWFMFKNLHIAKIQFFHKHFNKLQYTAAVVIHFSGILLRILLYLFMGIVKADKSFFTKSFYFGKLLFTYPDKYKNGNEIGEQG